MEESKSEQIRKQREQLPIFEFRDEIDKLILANNFCIITGDTGSGKSTQLPQFILDSEKLNEFFQNIRQRKDQRPPNIVVTQPRRVATIAMARRLCYERQEELGNGIGYTIRFDDRCSERTYLRYETDGILVRECLQDRDLKKYDVVILDEAHERSLYTDILMALMKQAVLRRKGELKLIVTSATLNTDQFSKYFENCPVLKMKGRSFPVEIKYYQGMPNKRVEESVKAAIRMHLHEQQGDILVFLTGSEECEMARKLCISELTRLKEQPDRKQQIPRILIYTLYGNQHSEEQAQVFQRSQDVNTRKLIFATNIAETSLTIDGIVYVIDCGYVKQKSYNPRTGMDALIVVPVSKVQAIQRAGRAGRTQPGKCYRLYSEKFFLEEMKENTVPEILRVNLANVMLSLKDMGFDDVINFDFMEKPDNDAILQALKQLFLLTAIDADGKITKLGQEMCKFPLEPSYAKALLSSILMDSQDDMLTIVSMLSSENIWQKPSRVNQTEFERFQTTQKEFTDLEGDHHTLLKIYNRWKKNNFSEHFCKQNFLNSRALKMTENIKIQLREIIQRLDLDLCTQIYKLQEPLYQIYSKSKILDQNYLRRHPRHGLPNTKPREDELTPADVLKLCLTTGFYFNSARKLQNEDNMFLLIYPEGNLVEIDPSSVYSLVETWPECVIYTELAGSVQTRGVIRLLSDVRYSWIKLLIPKIKEVDVFRLAGIDFDAQKKSDNLKRKAEIVLDEKELENQKKLEKEKKMQLHLQKFQERNKKIKGNNTSNH